MISTATGAVLDELIRADRALTLAFERSVGLSRSRLELLCALAETPGEASQAELRRRLGVDAAVITRQLAHMEGAGLITRSTHPGDRRLVVTRLTPAGRRRLEELQARRAAFEARLRAECGEARIDDLARSLRWLRERLEACSTH